MICVKHLRLRSVVVAAALACPLVAAAQTTAGAQASPGEAGRVSLATRRAVPPNVIRVDLGGLLSGELVIEYERALTPSFSVTAAARARLFGGFDGEVLNYDTHYPRTELGLAALVGVRVYTMGYAPQGFFVGLSVGGGWFKMDYTRSGSFGAREYDLSRFIVSLDLGYQWVIRQGLSISIGAGFTQMFGHDDAAYVPLRLSFGYAF